MGMLDLFESAVRRAYLFTAGRAESEGVLHPFEERNIHSALPKKVKELFDDGHYPNAFHRVRGPHVG
jgi:hypothetical protein